MDFELARRASPAEGEYPPVRRPGTDPARARGGQRRQSSEGLAEPAAQQGRGARPVALRRAGGVRRPRPRHDGQDHRLERGLAHDRACRRAHLSIFGPPVSPILYTLEGEAREKYLLPVIRGEKRSCFAQTEADAGSDPAAMRTIAVRDGDHYVINGVKRFITGADEADFAQVFAVTDPEKRSRGGIIGLSGRHGYARREGGGLLRPDGRRPAMRDRVRQRAGTGRQPHRQGRRRLSDWRNPGSIPAASATAPAASA